MTDTNIALYKKPIRQLRVVEERSYNNFSILRLVDEANNNAFVCLLTCDPQYARELIIKLNGIYEVDTHE